MNYKTLLYFALITVIAGSCNKDRFLTTDLFGHAGNGLEIANSVYHNNSKESIELALSLEGSNGVEVDVRMSADGALWLLHEDKLETETSGSGCVSEKTSEELRSFHYKSANQEKLVELASLPFSNYGETTFLLDVRHYNGCNLETIDYELFIQKIIELIAQNSSINFIIVTNFETWIPLFAAEGVHVYFEVSKLDQINNLSTNLQLAQGFAIKNDAIEKDEVQKLQNENKKVIIFEVRSPKKIREALKKFPDGLITDDLRATIIEKY